MILKMLRFSLFVLISSSLISGQSEVQNDTRDICVTEDCVQVASSILNKLNFNIDPCDNFHQFVCDNFIKTVRVRQEQKSISPWTISKERINLQLKRILWEPIQKNEPKFMRLLKIIYTSCMDTSQIETETKSYLAENLARLGGWPVLQGDDWKESNFDWKDLLFGFMALGWKSDFFFDLSIGPNEKNPTKRLLKISHYCCPHDYLLSGFQNPQIVANYELMIDIVTMFGANRGRARKDMKEVMQFYEDLARLTATESAIDSDLKTMTIRELEHKVSSIPWLFYINSYLSPTSRMHNDDTVGVHQPKLLQKIANLIMRTDKRTVANYMFWFAIQDLQVALPEGIQDRYNQFKQIAERFPYQSVRSDKCVKIAQKLDTAMSALFANKFSNQDAKLKASVIANNIYNSMLDKLKNIEFMDGQTRNKALSKIKKMSAFIGYSEEVLKNSTVDNLHKSLELNPHGSFIKNILNISLFSKALEIKSLKQPVRSIDWRTFGLSFRDDSNYDHLSNKIELPAGILQDPYFNDKVPYYVNFGSLGFKIGQELVHSFDEKGRCYDEDSKPKDWWSSRSEENFKHISQCFIRQTNDYETDPDIFINENAAIEIAYEGFEKLLKYQIKEPSLPGLDFSPRQMFWISAASSSCTKYNDQHLINRNYFKTNVAFAHSKYFSRDFNCRPGTFMNPRSKCSLW